MADRGKPKLTDDDQDNLALQVVQTIIERAVDGVSVAGFSFPSAESWANEYIANKRLKNDEKRIDEIIWHSSQFSFTAGFLTGLGGILTLPVTLPTSIVASWVIQARMAAAIAHVRGYDLKDDKVRMFILLALLADNAKDALKQVGVKIAEEMAWKAVKSIPNKLVKEINKQVGFRLLAKTGEKSIITLSKVVPFAGALAGGIFDGAACLTVGSSAKLIFSNRDETVESPEPSTGWTWRKALNPAPKTALASAPEATP